MAEILSIGELLDLGGSASTAGLIPYSALEYSAQKITAISGTAIGGNVDSATVTAIVNSSVSSKVDQSAFDHCCSSMSSVVSSLETSVTSMSSVVSGLTGDYLEKTASSMFQPSGDYAYSSSLSSYLPGSASSQFAPSGDYAYNSALSAYQPSGDYAFNSSVSSKLDESAFTAYTATATQGHTYTGVNPIVVDNANDRISLSATPVQLDGTMTSYMSGGTGFIGVNGNITSQMTSFIKTGDMSGYIPTSESAKYQLTADMSSYATTAQLSGKLDSSAQVVTSTGGSSYYVNKINGSYILAETATRSTYATFVSTNSGQKRLDDMWSSVTSLETGKLDASANIVTATATGHSINFGDFVSGINGMEIYATEAKNADTAYYARSAKVARRVDGNITITDVPFSAFALESSVSSKLDASASSDFYSTGNPSGFTNYLPNFGYNADDEISSIDGSAVAGGWNYTSPSGTIGVDNANGTLESLNSSMRVDEQVTPASSVSGSGYNLYGHYTALVLNHMTSLPGDTLYANLMIDGARSASAAFYGSIVNGGSAVLTSMIVSGSGGGFTYYSATVPLNESYSAIYLSASAQWGQPPSLSATATVEHPGSTAYLSSVYEQVLKDSMWQSLTAWAVAQGWTP